MQKLMVYLLLVYFVVLAYGANFFFTGLSFGLASLQLLFFGFVTALPAFFLLVYFFRENLEKSDVMLNIVMFVSVILLVLLIYGCIILLLLILGLLDAVLYGLVPLVPVVIYIVHLFRKHANDPEKLMHRFIYVSVILSALITAVIIVPVVSL